jgi:AraC family transcriptional regulator
MGVCLMGINAGSQCFISRGTNAEVPESHWKGCNPMSSSASTDAFFPGQRFQIQRYQADAGEYLTEPNDRHLLVQMGESAWAERRGGNGSWTKFLVERGSLAIVPSGPVPEVRLLTSCNMIVCALEENFTRKIAQEIGRQPANRTAFHLHDAPIAGLLDLMIKDFEASRPCAIYSETLAHALAMRFLFCGSSLQHTPNSPVEPLPPRILTRIRDRIEAELDTDLSLASLAKESGYSRAHFLRMFRVATGLTPHQYVLERRLSTAQHLLRQTRMFLVEIALECGFSSQTHMNDVFRKRLGITPLEYRRKI